MGAIRGTACISGSAFEKPAIEVGEGAIDFHCQRSGLRVVGDVRIHNESELRRALGLEHAPTVGELLVAAHLRWGPGGAARIVGDFAFVVWDERQRRLYCTRDVFGVRPFYYGWQPGRLLAFGTEVGAILDLDAFGDDIDQLALADLLRGRFVDHASTLHAQVRRLPPAHYLVADDHGVRIDRYWDFDPDAELALASDREYEEGYRFHLGEAVRCRLPEEGSVGAMLSGGIDSSSLVGLASDQLAERGGGPLPTFSNIFSDARESDERCYIEAVLKRGDVTSHLTEGGRHDPLGSIDSLLDLHRAPVFGVNSFLVAALGHEAKKVGVGVLLDGFGGDSVTSHGWLRFRELASDLRMIKLGNELRSFGSDLGTPWPRIEAELVWRYGLRSRAPAGLRRLGSHTRRSAAAPTSILGPDLVRVVRENGAWMGRPDGPLSSARAEHLEEITSPVIPGATEITYQIEQSIGVEFRYPFLDRRLAEYCVALPSDQKLRDGWTRSVARRALPGVLPEEIRWRRDKADLSHNFIHVLRSQSRGTLEHAINVDPGPIEPVLNIELVRAALTRLDNGGASPSDAQLLWLTAVTHRWLSRR